MKKKEKKTKRLKGRKQSFKKNFKPKLWIRIRIYFPSWIRIHKNEWGSTALIIIYSYPYKESVSNNNTTV